MSFKENAYQQMSFTDSFFGLTAREQKALEKSWAKIFADEIFPAIDETRFCVLYSDKASRPNTPVNVIVGALIIKELFDYSDDEMVENLMLDFRIQYALHTTSFEDEKHRLLTKEDGGMRSSMMQNPSDPEATFRSKAGKEHRGYAANLEESVGENGSVVTEYQYDQNNHSDSQFIREHLEQMDKQEESTVIVTDGAYSGTENTRLAAEKNVELITTSLTGKAAPDIFADFEFNEEGTRVLRCPAL